MVRIKHRYLLVNLLYPDNNVHTKDHITLKEDLPWTIRFRQPTADTVTSKQLMNSIRKNVEELFGDYGAGMIGGSLQGEQFTMFSSLIDETVKYFSAATSTAIIRVGRAHYRMVWSALTFMRQIAPDQPCVFQVVRVSGTIRKSEEEAIRRARGSILRARASNTLSLPLTHTGRDDDDMSAGIEDSDEADDAEYSG